jgi:ADP-ribose pyrophosphatase
MPAGNVAKREVVENFGAVAILAIDEDNNIVLVYQYRQPLGRRLWELPAGLLDVAGEPAHVSAARELQEEAGLVAADWRVLVDLDTAPGFSDESVRIYLATVLSDADRPNAHDEEADLLVKWFPLVDAVRMVFDGEIVNSIAVAGILAAHTMPDTGLLRPVAAPWTDRPTSFPRRKSH